MEMANHLSREQYEANVADLSGRRLLGVRYFPLEGVTGEVEVWDFGLWHQPTMGVELETADGAVFSAVWGSSFGHFGLELMAQPMDRLLIPEAHRPVAVEAHCRWASVVGQTVTVEIVWAEDVGEGGLLPVAVQLSGAFTTLWILAAAPVNWPPTGDMWLGTDDVMVVFDASLASSMGIRQAG